MTYDEIEDLLIVLGHDEDTIRKVIDGAKALGEILREDDEYTVGDNPDAYLHVQG